MYITGELGGRLYIFTIQTFSLIVFKATTFFDTFAVLTRLDLDVAVIEITHPRFDIFNLIENI
jgi:hypothetical protein